MSNLKFSIIIPTWRGVELLKKNLPSVLEVGADEVIVVDDASPDNDANFVRKNHPQIRVFRNQKNTGFGTSVNRGVAKANGEIIILLNQDVKPKKDILKYLKEDFKDNLVFGVSLAEKQYGPRKQIFKDGFIAHQSFKKRPRQVSPTFWANGGSGAFRKSYWDKLRGFDPIYDPGYWEDIDISYRAQKRGWLVLWDPRAKAEHEHGLAFGSKHYNQAYKRRIQERNHLLFNWKNLQDPSLKTKHFFSLMIRIIRHPGYLRIIWMAVMRLHKMRKLVV